MAPMRELYARESGSGGGGEAPAGRTPRLMASCDWMDAPGEPRCENGCPAGRRASGVGVSGESGDELSAPVSDAGGVMAAMDASIDAAAPLPGGVAGSVGVALPLLPSPRPL